MWNKILQWTSDFKNRQSVLQEFNNQAKEKFIKKTSRTLIEAKTTIGCQDFKHTFSKFMASGFNIKAFASAKLKPEEVKSIGIEILKDDTFVRKLISLGWDTLEVQDSESVNCFKWELKRHINAVA